MTMRTRRMALRAVLSTCAGFSEPSLRSCCSFQLMNPATCRTAPWMSSSAHASEPAARQDCELTFVSGQGALVAEGSMRRSRSQYSSHALRADRYSARVDSGLSSQCCLHHRILT
jgi:hypothetical protein